MGVPLFRERMMVRRAPYTTQLQAGLGLVEETKALLDLWLPGMTTSELVDLALNSGRFPMVTARRLRNIVAECFAPRYLVAGGAPASTLKKLHSSLSNQEFIQLLLLFTSRANLILGDFVREVYWPRYAGGYEAITSQDARAFVQHAMDDGKTAKRWSDATVRRISAYLTGCCADYGLLEAGMRSTRRIHPVQITGPVAAYVAYDLHLAGVNDGAILQHDDWKLFGLAPADVLSELKRLSLKGLLIVQSSGDLVRVTWKQKDMEGLLNVLA
jgi:hypothetical protein